MTDASLDPRFSTCTEAGKAELSVYLQWITDAKLADTEYSFIAYVLGRAQIKDPRHLFSIWAHQMGGNIDRQTKSQIRRFFMNPSTSVAFNSVQSAGWFDFVPTVYQSVPTVPAPNIQIPTFTKVGFSDLPD